MLSTLIARVRAAAQHAEAGQGLAEYALILALIAIVSIVALMFLSGDINSLLSTIGNSVGSV